MSQPKNIEYNNGMPMYWRDEMSGKLLTAVMAYWTPYADTPDHIPELNDDHVSALRMYLIHWAEAPCWRRNPHANAEHNSQLESAIALAKSIFCRSDISNTLDALLELSIDPF